jgi:hypothetical protein
MSGNERGAREQPTRSARVIHASELLADGGAELELERRRLERLERLSGLAGSTTLGPMRPHLVRAARSVGDTAVKRLYRQPAFRALADQRVEAPAEPVDLDDVASPDSLDSHVAKRTREPGASPVAHLAPTAITRPSTLWPGPIGREAG